MSEVQEPWGNELGSDERIIRIETRRVRCSRHRRGPLDETNCLHALGTYTFSSQLAGVISSHSAVTRSRLIATDESRRIFDSPLERVRRSYRLCV